MASRLSTKRRGTSLWRTLGSGRYLVLALTLLAIGALVPGLSLPVMHLRRGLSGHEYSVLAGILNLAQGGNVLLALILVAFSVIFPVAKIGTLLALLFLPLNRARRTRVLRTLTVLGRWSMLDVFVIAILVGAVRLGVLSEGQPRPGLYVFAAAILLSMLSTMTLEQLAAREIHAQALRALHKRGRSGRWVSLVACALFLTGLWLPLMSVEKWVFWDSEYSVLGGARALAEEGEGLLAGAVLLFVVVLPLARYVGLAWFQWGTPSPRAARVVLFLDKWAMLDVFGLALLIVLVKIGDLAAVTPRPGFWILLLAVSLSLFDSWCARRAR